MTETSVVLFLEQISSCSRGMTNSVVRFRRQADDCCRSSTKTLAQEECTINHTRRMALLACLFSLFAIPASGGAPDNTFKQASGRIYYEAPHGGSACHASGRLTITLDPGKVCHQAPVRLASHPFDCPV